MEVEEKNAVEKSASSRRTRYGKYELLLSVWLGLHNIVNSIHLISSVFISATPDYRCQIPGWDNDTYSIQSSPHNETILSYVPIKDTGDYDQCKVYENSSVTPPELVKCSDFVYDTSLFISTTVSKFNLVCDRTAVSTVANVIYMFGLLVGSFVFGLLSDLFGRKKIFMIAIVIQGLAALITMFSPNVTAFIILRFILGGSSIGALITAFVMMAEIAPKGMVPIAAMIQTSGWCVGVILLSLLGYLIRDWKYLQLCTACFSVPFIFGYWWLIDESIRWLISKDRREEAYDIIQKLNKRNNTSWTEVDFVEGSSVQKQSVKELLRAKFVILNCLNSAFQWFVVSMGYYGLALNVGNLVGDLYINNFIGGLIELPAYLILLFTMKTGRKIFYIVLMLVGGVALVISAFLIVYTSNRDLNWVIVAISMIGKFAVAAAFELVYFWCSEMYPTSTRNFLVGTNSVAARIGGMVAPVLADVPKISTVPFASGVAPITFGAFMIVAGLLAFLLPETLHSSLPETITQANLFTPNFKAKKDGAARSQTSKDEIELDSKTQ